MFLDVNKLLETVSRRLGDANRQRWDTPLLCDAFNAATRDICIKHRPLVIDVDINPNGANVIDNNALENITGFVDNVMGYHQIKGMEMDRATGEITRIYDLEVLSDIDINERDPMWRKEKSNVKQPTAIIKAANTPIDSFTLYPQTDDGYGANPNIVMLYLKLVLLPTEIDENNVNDSQIPKYYKNAIIAYMMYHCTRINTDSQNRAYSMEELQLYNAMMTDIQRLRGFSGMFITEQSKTAKGEYYG